MTGTVVTLPGLAGTLRAELPDYRQHLEAERKSPRTIESYDESVAQLADFLRRAGMPQDARAIHRERPSSITSRSRKFSMNQPAVPLSGASHLS